MTEKVNHPSHYNELPAFCPHCGRAIECIDVVRHMDFDLGNAMKYIWRAGYKDKDATIVDLQKAIWYLADKIHQLEQATASKNTSS